MPACAVPPADPVAPASVAVLQLAWQRVADYPHDPRAFTQGLVWQDGRLYESTGRLGQSGLREVELASGKVLREVKLAPEEFGEGLALAGGRLFQLTWQNGVAYSWDPASFERRGEHPFEGEGWGLTFDGHRLIQSDGSSRLTVREPATFAVTGMMQVVRSGLPQFYLNELEFFDGAIWANVWMSDEVVRIDPASGRVTGVLDLAGLLGAGDAARADVLNGLAWNPKERLLYVTGKHWPKLFALALDTPRAGS